MDYKVLITISKETWDAVPMIARALELSSDAQNERVISEIVEALIADKMFELANEKLVGPREIDAAQVRSVVDNIVNPNVALDFQFREGAKEVKEQLSLLQKFDRLRELYPGDRWIKAVVDQTEHSNLWRIALATVYEAVRDQREREQSRTWALIERTYRLLVRGVKVPVDNGGGNVSSSPTSPLHGDTNTSTPKGDSTK